MTLENKLNLTNEADLAREEEKKSKIKAKELFDTGYLDNLEPGTFKTLSKIHKYLFDEIYYFAGEIRKENIAKGNFRFAPLSYIIPALENVEKMPQSTSDEIIEKYVEMNIVHLLAAIIAAYNPAGPAPTIATFFLYSTSDKSYSVSCPVIGFTKHEHLSPTNI